MRTVAVAAEDDVWRGRLLGAGAVGVQAVEGVVSAVPRRGQRLAPLRVPAVNVTAVTDAALRAL